MNPPESEQVAPDAPAPARRSRAEIAGWFVVGLCLVLALVLRPLAVAAGSQELEVTVALYRSGLVEVAPMKTELLADQVDPWGHRWCYKAPPDDPDPKADPRTWRWGYYSAGPNGIDENGLGDDAWSYPMPWTRPDCRFLAWSREGLLLLAITLAWLLAHPFRRAPRGTTGREAVRAALIAVFPALIVMAVSAWFAGWIEGHAGEIADAADEKVLTPLPLALFLSSFLVLFFGAFVARLRAKPTE